MPSLEDIKGFCQSMRIALEPGLSRDEHGLPISAGACLHAAVWLASSLNRFSMARAVVCGGGDGIAGARDVHGTLRGHYWIVATLHDGTVVIIDITADQFGHPPVRVIDLSESHHLYVAGEQAIVDEAVRAMAQHLGVNEHLQTP